MGYYFKGYPLKYEKPVSSFISGHPKYFCIHLDEQYENPSFAAVHIFLYELKGF